MATNMMNVRKSGFSKCRTSLVMSSDESAFKVVWLGWGGVGRGVTSGNDDQRLKEIKVCIGGGGGGGGQGDVTAHTGLARWGVRKISSGAHPQLLHADHRVIQGGLA